MTNFERGALLLRDVQGTVHRLSWNEADSAPSAEGPAKILPGEDAGAQQDVGARDAESEGERALPAGHYTLIGYRLNRKDAAGVRWDLSATQPKLRKLEIVAGERLEVSIDEQINIRHKLGRKQFGVNVQGDGGAGLAIYRAGTRIPIEFQLQDKLGQTRFEGRIRYG